VKISQIEKYFQKFKNFDGKYGQQFTYLFADRNFPKKLSRERGEGMEFFMWDIFKNRPVVVVV